MSSSVIDLSIIIPAYMEADRISDALTELATFLDSRQYGNVEVLVITADSQDGTAKIAAAQAGRFEHFRVIKAGPRMGKGRDVRLGIFEARGKYRMFMDADLATPLIHLDEVKKFMDNGGDIAIAVRNLFTIHKTILRKTMSKAANIAAQVLVVPGIKDTQCGFKVFKGVVAEEIFSRMTMLQWSFDIEVLAIARQLHYNVEFIETPDWADPKAQAAGLSGDSILKVALGGFMDPLIIRLGIVFGRYRSPNYTHKFRY